MLKHSLSIFRGVATIEATGTVRLPQGFLMSYGTPTKTLATKFNCIKVWHFSCSWLSTTKL